MPPTTAEEEDLNSALIAHLLAEDRKESEMYYNEYGNSGYYDRYVGVSDERDDSYEEGSEDDYAPKQNKKSKKKKAKKAEEKEKKKGTQRVKKGKKNNDEVGEQNNHDQSTSTLANNIENGSATTETVENVASATTTVNEDASTITTTTTTKAATTGKTSKAEKPKKEKKPLPPGMNGGVYTDAEEVLFLEGLSLYGRNWADLAKHIGTRESHSVRSHAQKHFIKLYRDNLPLPDKVKESGEGYTLSGKPLDPNSAAAKPYLNRGGSTTEAITAKVENIKITQPESNKDDKSTINNESSSELTNTQVPSSTPVVTLKRSKSESTQPKPKKAKLPSKPNTQKKSSEKQTEKQTEPTTTYDENGRTRYASSRLRSQQQKSDSTYEVIGLNSDPLTLVKCEEFDKNVDRSHANAQPFSLGIDTNTLLVMDFHAHLMTTEIIGLLAGTWDWKQRRIEIKEAYPCKSLNTGQNEVNVEMDPSSAFEVRQMIEQKNMKVVGWYHSHPTFVPDPSLIDIENQHNYQRLSQDKYTIEPTKTEAPTSSTIANEATLPSSEKNEQPKTVTIEPFVGAIVTPYDPDLTTSASAINWFYVSNNEHTNSNIPRRLEYEIVESKNLSEEEERRMLGLLDEYKESPEKTKFNDVWKVDSTENKLIKLIKSIASRMPWIERQLVNKLNNNVNSKNDNNTDTTTTSTTTTTMDDIKMNDANTDTTVTTMSDDRMNDNNTDTATTKTTNDNKMDDDSIDTTTATNENKMKDDNTDSITLTSNSVDTASTTTTNDNNENNDKDITMKEGDNQNLQQMDIDKDYNILDGFLQKIEKLIKDW